MNISQRLWFRNKYRLLAILVLLFALSGMTMQPLFASMGTEGWSVPVKIAQEVMVRPWNLADSAAEFILSLSPGPIWSAKRTTHIETPLEDATVTNDALAASLAAYQIGTFSVKAFTSFDDYLYLPLILKK